MLEVIATHLQALPLAVQLVGLCILLALGDFLLALVAHLKDGTFHGTLVGQWVYSKGLPIITIAILYGLDAAVHVINIPVGDTDLGMFGVLAYGMALTFIAQEAFSIVKNARMLGGEPEPNPPVTEP